MLGWHISVYRQAADRSLPATPKSAQSERVAVWQTGAGGLGWIDGLVSEGKAIYLGGNGYPYWYTAQAVNLLPQITSGPAEAHAFWAAGGTDILGKDWEGQTKIDAVVVSACSPEEWLYVEVWDES